MNTEIALALLKAADAKAAPKDVLTDLYPFIFTASKRMSGREVSEFLEKNYNIKISQPTLARALKEPEAYTADFSKDAYEAANLVKVLLGLDSIWEVLNGTAYAHFIVDEHDYEESGRREKFETALVRQALKELEDGWLSVSKDFRDLCEPEISRLDAERQSKTNASRL